MKDEDKTKVEPIKDLKTLRKKREKSAVNNITERKQAEEEIKSAAAKWQTTFDAMNDAVTLMDNNGIVLQCNQSYLNLIGKTETEILGKHCWEINHGTNKPIDGCPYVKMKKSLQRESMLLPIGDKWFNVVVDPIFDASNNLIKAVHIMTDITEHKQAEEALKENQEKYRALYDNAPLSYQSLNENGSFIDVNPAWLRTLGYNREEIIGKWFGDFLHPDYKAHFEKNFPEFKRRGYVHKVQFKIRHKDGHFLDISFEGCIGYYPNGSFRQTYCVFQDITERKQAEERIKHLNLVLRTISNVNQIIIKETDREKLIKSICHALIQSRGYYCSWIILLDKEGKPESYAEAGLEKAFLTLAKQLKKGHLTSCCQQALTQKDIVRIKDSVSLCTDCPLSSQYVGRGVMVIRLENQGKVYGFMSVSTPVHFIKDKEEQDLFKEVADDIAFALYSIESEEERKKAEEKYYSLFESSKDGIAFTNMEGNFLNGNQAFLDMLGYRIDEVRRLTYKKLLPKKWQNGIINNLEKIRIRGYSDEQELELTKKDRTIFPISIRIWMINNEQGKPAGMWAMIRDITERKQVEEALAESEAIFKGIFSQAPVGTELYDSKGNLISVNQKCLNIFGVRNVDEIKGFKLFEDPNVSAEAKNKLRNGELVDYQSEFDFEVVKKLKLYKTTRSGKCFLHVQITPYKISDLGNKGFVVHVQDITERKRAEEALRESEEKYSSVVENSKDGIIVVQKGIIKFFNQAVLNLTGYNLEELIDKEFESLLSPEYRKLVMDRYHARLAGKETPSVYEIEIIRKDGISVPVEVSNTTITYGGEKATLSFIRNITERKQAEEALRASRDYLEKLTNSMWDAVFSVKMPERVIEWANDSFRLTGYEPSECIGKSPDFLYSDKDEFLDFGNKLKDAMAAGKDVLHADQLMKRKNGETFPAEITVTFHKENDEAVSLTTIVRDITERKQAEDELRGSEEKIRAIFNASPDVIHLLDINGIILATNEGFAKRLGLEIDDVVGKCVFDYTPYEVIHKRKAAIDKIFRTGEPLQLEDKGLTGVFESHIHPIFNPAGEVKAVAVYARDITERKQAEERLKKTMEATLDTISKIIEAKDPYTSGHQHRVCQLAVPLARELGLSEDKIEGIRIASLIHDIGKISIPTEILSKTTTLSDIEFSLIKEHARTGYDILKSINFSYPIAQIVLQHHEKMNGSGYPRGLKDKEILLEAKIICVADVVEAMSSHRPYRPALGIDKALEEISQNKGILYDPEVVEACLKLFKEKEFKFEL